MSVHGRELAESGIVALLFGATFLFGGRLHPFRWLALDRRSLISFAAGMSAAYVFVHVMPEMQGVRSALVESVSAPLRYEGMGVYFVALLGFLAFYALDHLRNRMGESVGEGSERASFRVHVGGFAAYAWLMSYLLVHGLAESAASTALYAVAIAFHFLTVDHSLRGEHGDAYQRFGRPVLAAACLGGWGTALLVELPHGIIALLMAFVSGAVIMNSAIMELPSEKDGRFLPFVAGGLSYGLILLPLG